jgi:acetyl esterase/lipase
MGSRRPAPPLDPELAAGLAVALDGTPSPITLADVSGKRLEEGKIGATAVADARRRGIRIEEVDVPSYDSTPVRLSLLYGPSRSAASPFIYYIHGGGMMLGNRWSGLDVMEDWIRRFNAVVATIEYRLAPEYPFPAPQEDSYAGLLWAAQHQSELGINVEAGLIAGISAGGGLAASVALMARDRGGPKLAGMVLLAPMLDDRSTAIASRQFSTSMWSVEENELGWRSLLGDRAGGPDPLPPHAAPGRCDDLSGLPHAFLEVGSAEIFRDETVEFGSRIWRTGGRAELHVWSGAFHGFEILSHTLIAQSATQVRNSWIERVLGVPESPTAVWSTEGDGAELPRS